MLVLCDFVRSFIKSLFRRDRQINDRFNNNNNQIQGMQ